MDIDNNAFIYEGIATVKAVNPRWINYLILVKVSDKWLLANAPSTENRMTFDSGPRPLRPRVLRKDRVSTGELLCGRK